MRCSGSYNRERNKREREREDVNGPSEPLSVRARFKDHGSPVVPQASAGAEVCVQCVAVTKETAREAEFAVRRRLVRHWDGPVIQLVHNFFTRLIDSIHVLPFAAGFQL